MKFIPDKIFQIIEKNNCHYDENIIYNNKMFIVLEDIKHNDKSYHYVAWIKKDVRSIIEINNDIINEIVNIRNILLKNGIIKSNHYAFIHFPPSFWRLHIHFVDNNHMFCAPKHEILYIDDIIIKINNNPNFFKTNIRICFDKIYNGKSSI
jgi:hypothetical protein